MKWGLGVVCLVLCTQANAGISEAEFKQRTSYHQARIIELAVAARDEFKEFHSLDRKLVRDYLDVIHDAPKLMDLAELKESGYPFDQSIAQILGKYYGLSKFDLPDFSRSLLENTILELNRIEDSYREMFFEVNRVTKRQALLLKTLEHIVDIVDVGIARRQEMGLGSEALASHWYRGGAEWEMAVIWWLEDHYALIIYGGRAAPSRCEFILGRAA